MALTVESVFFFSFLLVFLDGNMYSDANFKYWNVVTQEYTSCEHKIVLAVCARSENRLSFPTCTDKDKKA